MLNILSDKTFQNNLTETTNDAVQLLKFHGSYQQDDREQRKKGSSKDWQMMLRLRSPGGLIPSSLYFLYLHCGINDVFRKPCIFCNAIFAIVEHSMKSSKLISPLIDLINFVFV